MFRCLKKRAQAHGMFCPCVCLPRGHLHVRARGCVQVQLRLYFLSSVSFLPDVSYRKGNSPMQTAWHLGFLSSFPSVSAISSKGWKSCCLPSERPELASMNWIQAWIPPPPSKLRGGHLPLLFPTPGASPTPALTGSVLSSPNPMTLLGLNSPRSSVLECRSWAWMHTGK